MSEMGFTDFFFFMIKIPAGLYVYDFCGNIRENLSPCFFQLLEMTFIP